MSRLAAWWQERVRQQRIRRYRAELKRIRATISHLRCELFLAYERAAEVDGTDPAKAAQLRNRAAEFITTDFIFIKTDF